MSSNTASLAETLARTSSIRRHCERTLRRAIKRLNSLGYKVTVQEAQAD
jgi:hypothetical protein